MCIIYAKNNGAVANLGKANICFTINYSFNMLFCHFRYFHFCNTDMSFVKMTSFPSSTMSQIFMILKNFTYICKNPILLSVISKFRKQKEFRFFNSRICANGYCSIANGGYIYYQVSKNWFLKMLLCLLVILATVILILLKTLWKTLF